jgi:signal transduction histidine kinase
MMPRSVTSRLITIYCLLLVLLGGAFMVLTVLSFRYYTRETMSSNLEVRGREIWNTAEEYVDRPAQLATIIERRFSPEAQDRFIRIRIGDRLLYTSDDPLGGGFVAAQVPRLNAHAAPKTELVGNLLLHAREFQAPRLGTVSIATGQSYQSARIAEARLAKLLFIGLPPLLLLAAIAGYVLMRRALKPVENMINAAESYTFNDPQKRLPLALAGAEPRIEALSLALNRMLDRLESAYSHASRFSADAAHELRTPLTIIRGELELVGLGARLPSDVDNAIGNALEEMTRLSGIVDGLITLSRMDSVWGKHVHAPVDLGELAAETIEQMNLLAEEKRIGLKGPSGSAVVVVGDRNRLKQVLVNLIDNAIKYTPQGGWVSVETGIEGDMGVVAVEDSGAGIDLKHHDRVFDRFYRVLPDLAHQGAGLGLSIVKSICNAHGGSVSLRSVPEIGSCFKVEIPLLTIAGENIVLADKTAATALYTQ